MLKMTAQDLYQMHLVDEIVPEPAGGAHTNHAAAAALLRPVLRSCLERLSKLPAAELLKRRQEKFRRLASFVSES